MPPTPLITPHTLTLLAIIVLLAAVTTPSPTTCTTIFGAGPHWSAQYPLNEDVNSNDKQLAVVTSSPMLSTWVVAWVDQGNPPSVNATLLARRITDGTSSTRFTRRPRHWAKLKSSWSTVFPLLTIDASQKQTYTSLSIASNDQRGTSTTHVMVFTAVAKPGQQGDVYWVKSSNDGVSWGAVASLTLDPAIDDKDAVVFYDMENQFWYAAWIRFNGDDYDVAIAQSKISGLAITGWMPLQILFVNSGADELAVNMFGTGAPDYKIAVTFASKKWDGGVVTDYDIVVIYGTSFDTSGTTSTTTWDALQPLVPASYSDSTDEAWHTVAYDTQALNSLAPRTIVIAYTSFDRTSGLFAYVSSTITTGAKVFTGPYLIADSTQHPVIGKEMSIASDGTGVFVVAFESYAKSFFDPTTQTQRDLSSTMASPQSDCEVFYALSTGKLKDGVSGIGKTWSSPLPMERHAPESPLNSETVRPRVRGNVFGEWVAVFGSNRNAVLYDACPSGSCGDFCQTKTGCPAATSLSLGVDFDVMFVDWRRSQGELCRERSQFIPAFCGRAFTDAVARTPANSPTYTKVYFHGYPMLAGNTFDEDGGYIVISGGRKIDVVPYYDGGITSWTTLSPTGASTTCTEELFELQDTTSAISLDAPAHLMSEGGPVRLIRNTGSAPESNLKIAETTALFDDCDYFLNKAVGTRDCPHGFRTREFLEGSGLCIACPAGKSCTVGFSSFSGSSTCVAGHYCPAGTTSGRAIACDFYTIVTATGLSTSGPCITATACNRGYNCPPACQGTSGDHFPVITTSTTALSATVTAPNIVTQTFVITNVDVVPVTLAPLEPLNDGVQGIELQFVSGSLNLAANGATAQFSCVYFGTRNVSVASMTRTFTINFYKPTMWTDRFAGRPLLVACTRTLNTVTPTKKPTAQPTTQPSVAPTFSKPTRGPSRAPSKSPSRAPSRTPTTSKPSRVPSKAPSKTPSRTPSKAPSRAPTTSKPSKAPVSSTPTRSPSKAPSRAVCSNNLKDAGNGETCVDGGGPNCARRCALGQACAIDSDCDTNACFAQVCTTSRPSRAPSRAPSQTPSRGPSRSPSQTPSRTPTRTPSREPSTSPSKSPTARPSKSPSMAPTTSQPSGSPSHVPSTSPSNSPSHTPSLAPTVILLSTAVTTMSFTVGLDTSLFSSSVSVTNAVPVTLQYFKSDCQTNLPSIVPTWLVPEEQFGIALATPGLVTVLNFNIDPSATATGVSQAIHHSSPAQVLQGCVSATGTNDRGFATVVRYQISLKVIVNCPPGSRSDSGTNEPVACSPCPSGGYELATDTNRLACASLPCAVGYYCGSAAVSPGTYRQMISWDASLAATIVVKARRTMTWSFSNIDPQGQDVILFATSLPSIVASVLHPVTKQAVANGGEGVVVPAGTSVGFDITFDAADLSVDLSFFSTVLPFRWRLVDGFSGDVLEVFEFSVQVTFAIVTVIVSPQLFTFTLETGKAYDVNNLDVTPAIEVYNTLCQNAINYKFSVVSCDGEVSPPPPPPSWFSWTNDSIVRHFDDTKFVPPESGLPDRLKFAINLTDVPQVTDWTAVAPTSVMCMRASIELIGLSSVATKLVRIAVKMVSDCPPGYFSVTGQNGGGCTACPLDTFQKESASTLCLSCPETLPVTLSTGSAFNSSCVAQVDAFVNNQGRTESCPEGALCDEKGLTTRTLKLRPGYWRTGASSLQILKCPRAVYCVGGKNTLVEQQQQQQGRGRQLLLPPARSLNEIINGTGDFCTSGHAGVFCTTCVGNRVKRGYNRICDECTPSAFESDRTRVAGIFIGLSIAIFMVVGLVLWRAHATFIKRRHNKGRKEERLKMMDKFFEMVENADPTMIKIVLGFSQVLAAVSIIWKAQLPPFFVGVADFFTIMAMDVVQMFDLGCTLAAQDHYASLVISTTLPFLAFLLLYLVHMVLERKVVRGDAELRDELRLVNSTLALFLGFAIYPSVSNKVLKTYDCQTMDDGRVVLNADPSLSCLAPVHQGFVAYAAFATLLYVIGIPVFYTSILWRARFRINPPKDRAREDIAIAVRDKDRSIAHLRFLFKTYRPYYWWFETFELLRKLLQTAVVVFFRPGTASQIVFMLAVSILSVAVLHACRPYVRRRHLVLATIAQWLILLIMFIVLLKDLGIKTNSSATRDFDANSLDDLAAGIFIGFFVFAGLQAAVLFLYDNNAFNSVKRRLLGYVSSAQARTRILVWLGYFTWDGQRGGGGGAGRAAGVEPLENDEFDADNDDANTFGRWSPNRGGNIINPLFKEDWRSSFMRRRSHNENVQAINYGEDGESIEKMRERFHDLEQEYESRLDQYEILINDHRTRLAETEQTNKKLSEDNIKVRSELLNSEAYHSRVEDDLRVRLSTVEEALEREQRVNNNDSEGVVFGGGRRTLFGVGRRTNPGRRASTMQPAVDGEITAHNHHQQQQQQHTASALATTQQPLNSQEGLGSPTRKYIRPSSMPANQHGSPNRNTGGGAGDA